METLSKEQAREKWKQEKALYAAGPSHEVCALLAKHPVFLTARYVGIYAARTGEVNLNALWEARPKACVFPKVVSQTKMEFRTVGSLSELRPGFARILEPSAGEPIKRWSHLDLILVPGAAFDVYGGRVGSGAGFYDRFLQNHNAQAWGIGWESQIITGKLAQDVTDVRMRALCTERRLLWIEG